MARRPVRDAPAPAGGAPVGGQDHGGCVVSLETVWYGCSIGGYLARNVMIPRTGSYGDTPTVTRSPGTTLIRKRRIRPLNCASTSCPASHCTRYRPPE